MKYQARDFLEILQCVLGPVRIEFRLALLSLFGDILNFGENRQRRFFGHHPKVRGQNNCLEAMTLASFSLCTPCQNLFQRS